MSELIADLRREGKDAAADELERHQHNRSEHLVYRSSPGFGDSNWNVSVFSDVFASARRLDNDARQEQAIRLAYAARSLSPNWWWYGSDKRWLDDSDSPHPAMVDKGEMCLGPSGPANSMMLLQTLDRDYGQMSEGLLRLAFGGMIGVFALIRSDGGASMAFCPDAASRQYGTSALTGDIGQSLFHYLQGASSYVLPGRGGVTTFGCRLESSTKRGSESFVVRPWDGVGRRIVVRQLGLEATVRYGRILEFSFDARKRWAEFVIDNPSDKDMTARLELRGLWGSRFDVGGIEAQSEGGILETAIALPASKEVRTEIRVIE
jgi:hypothetical protein